MFKVILNVEKISLDNVLDRLRVKGTIVESNNESVPHGSHHSFIVKIDEQIKLIKKKWDLVEKKLVKEKNQKLGFLLVAIESSGCGIGRVKGTHLQILPNIYPRRWPRSRRGSGTSQPATCRVIPMRRPARSWRWSGRCGSARPPRRS